MESDVDEDEADEDGDLNVVAFWKGRLRLTSAGLVVVVVLVVETALVPKEAMLLGAKADADA